MQKLFPPLPFFFIGRDLALQRIRRFINGKHKVVSKDLGKPDTRNIWYSREHIATLLDEMDLLEATGLRIYFGTYEEEHEYAPGQTCLIMVPTRYNEKLKGQIDIVTEEQPGFGERVKKPKSEPAWRLNGDVVMASLPKEYNYGAPCPPVCNDPGGDGEG